MTRNGSNSAMVWGRLQPARDFSPATYDRGFLVAAGLLLLMGAAPVHAQERQRPPSLRPLMTQGLEVDEKVGRSIDLNLTFRDETGAEVPLKSFFNLGRPVLLDLVYYRCPKLCNLLLNGQVLALRELPFEPGKDYELVTVSIDPKETPQLAAEKKATYASTFKRPVTGWHFLTDPTGANAKALAGLVGFKYRYDPKIDQYVHPATFMVINQNGKVSRYLYGTRFRTFDMRMAITESQRGEGRFSVEKLLLICYQFDPAAKSYTVAATRLLQGAAAVVLVLLGIWLWRLIKWEKARSAMLKPNVRMR